MKQSGKKTLTAWLAIAGFSGAVTGIAMLADATPARALETKIGTVNIFFDTTVSAGVSVRTAKRNSYYLPEPSGGAPDTRPLVGVTSDGTLITDATGGTYTNPAEAALALGALTVTRSAGVRMDGTTYLDNFAGSTNTDDGRLNFDRGDLTSGVTKMTNDIEASWQNVTLFARVNSFYDGVLNSNSSYDRSGINSGGKAEVGRDIELLDLYLSADFDVLETPVNVRLGRQVISWGEGTFLFNGINSINPIDVNAFRRPGAEIKEGLLPIWAAYASIGLPYDLSLETFYQFGHEPYELDRAGTPFAASDVANPASTLGGNEGGIAFTSSTSWGGTIRRTCSVDDEGVVTLGGGAFINLMPTGDNAGEPNRDDFFNTAAQTAWAAQSPLLEGQNCFSWNRQYDRDQIEAQKLANGDLALVYRGADEEPSDSGQYGVALRWYSEALNSTEFGFYHMNYHSRLPISKQTTLKPVISFSSTAPVTTAISRQLGALSCLGLPDPRPGREGRYDRGNTRLAPAGLNESFAVTGEFAHPTLREGGPVDTSATVGNGADDQIRDPYNVFGTDAQFTALKAFAQARVVELRLVMFDDPDNPGTAIEKYPFPDVDFTDTTKWGRTLRTVNAINCPLWLSQAVTPNSAAPASVIPLLGFLPPLEGGLAFDGPVVLTGAESIALTYQADLTLEYPEDISLWGMSFNTTLGDWGIQGEVSYRENQPFQVDTDSITIGAAAASCAFATSDIGLILFQPNVTTGQSCDPSNLVGKSFPGHKRTDVWTSQIGTTALWTASQPAVGGIGADQFVFLSEVGAMYVPDVPRPLYLEGGDVSAQFSSTCTSGSDLPLGGLLSIDNRIGCRPTTFSWGYVLVGILDYNNAFGTAWTLSPSVAWSHDVKGNSPAPFSQYRERSRTLGLRVTASYQAEWRASLGYTRFMGDEIRVRNLDQDFLAFDVSYSF